MPQSLFDGTNVADAVTQLSTDRQGFYQAAMARLADDLATAVTLWKWLGYLRGAFFLLTLLSLAAWAADYLNGGSLWLWISGGGFALFLGVAYVHESLSRRIFVGRLRWKMHQDSLRRLKRQLRELDVPEVEIGQQWLGLARDLDLIGTNSLYRLLGTVRTPRGVEMLLEWMVGEPSADEIRERQSAVQELRDPPAWREEFQLICEQLSTSEAGPSRFVAWCESPDWTARWKWVLWLARGCLGILFLSLIGMIGGWLPLEWGGPILLASSAASFLLSVIFAGPIHDIFNQVSARQNDVMCYRRLFQALADFPAGGSKLKSLQRQLFHDGDLRSRLSQLSWLTWFANWRKNGIFFLPYILFQLLVFWDIHWLALLERWKRRNAGHPRQWFEGLAQWEVLTALAKLAWDHPAWCFPQVGSRTEANDLELRASGLAHPLLPPQTSVSNDVQVGPPGTLLLVTGSNMSGKSTLLRSLGMNVVLAQMGGPVCARSLQMTPLELATSMRISDSLAEGVSFFMAELQRLKAIVDRARQFRKDSPRGQLFLLDEILQGTNSRERQIAVSRVLRQLLDAGSIGAVSTHDLELAGIPDLKTACQPVYFCETFSEEGGRRTMTFDYKMHAGISPTTNALKLLELVGLA